MTSNAFTWGQPARGRRSTFVPSPAYAAARRLQIGAITAALAVSSAAVGIVSPLFF